ncbi:acyl carrier protein [Uliginosibacterium gangwonense]|uniref:acyl carrier protein n=1 Tax=Uliginosibacterium gangwonense TaxID=392736 RepID=UPI00037909A3|nr:acyl carrier protein [Uliginosibacterium gangwonense]
MGLESVELILSVEEEFGIRIEDSSMEHLLTPRLLAEYIISQLGAVAPTDKPCASQTSFYQIRRALIRQLDIPRKDVHPDTLLQTILPRPIRQQWHQLKIAINAKKLPPLQCPRQYAYAIFIVLSMIMLAACLLAQVPGWVIILALLISFYTATLICDRFGTLIPANISSVAHLIPYARLTTPPLWTREAVLHKVMQLTAEITGTSFELIQADHRFAQDIGMDQ